MPRTRRATHGALINAMATPIIGCVLSGRVIRRQTANPGFVAVSEATEAARQVRDNLNIGLERDLDV